MDQKTEEKAVKPLFKLPETQREFEKDFAEIQNKHGLSEGALERIRKLTIEKHQQREKAKIAQRRAAAAIAKAEQTAKAQERRDDTRKKIIAGALLLGLQDDDAWKESIASLLNTIPRDADRALFGLPPLPEPSTEAVETVAEVPQEPQAEDEQQEVAEAVEEQPQQHARKFSFDHLKH
jgi:DNA-binding Lrp family transcriptional regulator